MIKKMIFFAIVMSILVEVVPGNGLKNNTTYELPAKTVTNPNYESGILAKEKGYNNVGTDTIEAINEIFALKGGYGADEVSFKNTVITVGRYMYHVALTTKGLLIEIINGLQNV